jgi:hypothetical protein
VRISTSDLNTGAGCHAACRWEARGLALNVVGVPPVTADRARGTERGLPDGYPALVGIGLDLGFRLERAKGIEPS